MKCLSIFAFALCLAMAGNRAFADTLFFNLFDHPDGNAAPPTYGLKLHHNNADGNQDNLFHFANVVGQIDTASLEFSIQGLVWHGVGNSHHDYSGQVYYLNALIQLDAGINFANLASNSATPAITGDTNYLTLTYLGEDASLDQTAPDFNGNFLNFGDVFDPNAPTPGTYYRNFMDPGFRIENGHRGVSGLSGYGWLEPDNEAHIADQDWLFTMAYSDIPITPPPLTPVPVPAAAPMALLGLAGIAAWKRARRSA